MSYDINIHLPQQIENFLNIIASPKPDVNQLERIKQNIINLIDDSDFQVDMNSFEKTRQSKTKELINKAIESVKTIASSKNTEELFIDIDEIRNDVTNALNVVESDYWTNIESYMIKYLNSQNDDDGTKPDE